MSNHQKIPYIHRMNVINIHITPSGERREQFEYEIGLLHKSIKNSYRSIFERQFFFLSQALSIDAR